MAILIVRQIHLLIRNSTHSSVPSARAILSSAGSFNRKTLSRQDGSRHLDQSLVILANVMNMGTEAVAEHAAPVVPSFMQKSSDDAAKTYNPPELDNVSDKCQTVLHVTLNIWIILYALNICIILNAFLSSIRYVLHDICRLFTRRSRTGIVRGGGVGSRSAWPKCDGT